MCARTPNDRKGGGHLAVRIADGRLILRDSAQTAADEQPIFQDERIHPFFHANNLWLDLEQLRAVLVQRDGVLGLPLIRNEKTVDPSDPSSPAVIQLESAMGAAIEVFEGAQAIAVPRERFLPVKTTNELLLVRSDLFELGEDGGLVSVGEIPNVQLSPKYYRMISDFDARVRLVPSLSEAESLVVEGDWMFDRASAVRGTLLLPETGTVNLFR